MTATFTPRARTALTLAREEAVRLGHSWIEADHLLLGLLALDGVASNAIEQLGVDPKDFLRRVEESVEVQAEADAVPDRVSFAPGFRRALNFARQEARAEGQRYMGTDHLLVGVMREGAAAGIFKDFDLNLGQVREKLADNLNTGQRSKDELAKKLDTVMETLGRLSAEIAELRLAMPKGNA
jgi:ATP-dependent Clp protease ATP-binding subunit ClpC